MLKPGRILSTHYTTDPLPTYGSDPATTACGREFIRGRHDACGTFLPTASLGHIEAVTEDRFQPWLKHSCKKCSAAYDKAA